MCWEIIGTHVGQNDSKDVITAAVSTVQKQNVTLIRIGELKYAPCTLCLDNRSSLCRKYPRRDCLTGDLGGPQSGFGRFRNETNIPPPPPSSAIERVFVSRPFCSIATIIRKIQNRFLFVECSGRYEGVEWAVLWSAQPRSCISCTHYRQPQLPKSEQLRWNISSPPLSFSWKQQRRNNYNVLEAAVCNCQLVHYITRKVVQLYDCLKYSIWKSDAIMYFR